MSINNKNSCSVYMDIVFVCVLLSTTISCAPTLFILSYMPSARLFSSTSITNMGLVAGKQRRSQLLSGSLYSLIAVGVRDSLPGQKGHEPTAPLFAAP